MALDELIAVINDLHIPYHDSRSLELVFDCLRDIKPDKLIILGDMVDFDALKSDRFRNDVEEINLQYELDQTYEILNQISQLPIQERIFIKGNHEERLERYLAKEARSLSSLKSLSLEELLKLEDFKFEFVNDRFSKYRGVLYSHIDRTSKYGGYSAKNIGVEYAMDVVHAHTHKAGMVRLNDFTFIDNGCLCKNRQPWQKKPGDFVQAFTLVGYTTDNHWMELVTIKDHSFLWMGELYSA